MTINEDVNSVRRERLLYAVVWTLIALLPVVLELWKLINNSHFEWGFVMRWWGGMIPLILFTCDNTIPQNKVTVVEGGVGLANVRSHS